MAQTIKLKRSSVSGNTPGTSDLELGEVAINTYDGKMFIKKNDGSDSIELSERQKKMLEKSFLMVILLH